MYNRALTSRYTTNGIYEGGFAVLSGALKRFTDNLHVEMPDECYERGTRYGFMHVHFMK